MENILEKIIAAKHREVAEAKASKPYGEILREAEASARRCISFKTALESSATGIIAEFKRKSPSKGYIHAGAQAGAVAVGYEKAGAAALSVLTDSDWFAGSDHDLAEARALVSIPLLRKDFVVDRYQICRARIIGADAVLLIAAALTPQAAFELAAFARQLGLEVLLEIHDAAELRHINEHVSMVGVNNRNLGTFVTDVGISYRLAGLIPSDFTKISESGISSPATVRELKQAGFAGFLMGENFMKQPDPARALEQFIREIKTDDK